MLVLKVWGNEMLIGRREMLLATSTAAFTSAWPAGAGAVAGARPRAKGLEDAQAIVSITQLMSEWAQEVDTNYGRTIVEADVLTLDCRCKLEDRWIEGRDAIAEFYKMRFEGIKAGEPAPIIRQSLTNFRVTLKTEAEATIDLTLLLFLKVGKVPFSDYCDPVEVADVHASCRRGADSHWRISMLDSRRIFRRD
jgi:hypothetical protein